LHGAFERFVFAITGRPIVPPLAAAQEFGPEMVARSYAPAILAGFDRHMLSERRAAGANVTYQ